MEGYGSSESAVVIMRTPDTPANALGRPRPDDGSDIAVVDRSTCIECAPARFDQHGALSNGHDAIGELVNRRGGGAFEGYFANDEATAERLRNGWYWTGDLAYRDADGFFYFAGRTADWLRVDSENFSAAPVEVILHRFVGCVMVAAYAVPDPRTGDQVMAAIEMAPGHGFDPGEFVEFLTAQRDLGTKWAPRLVRSHRLDPLTPTQGQQAPLRAEAWRCPDPVWWRPAGDATYRLMTAATVPRSTRTRANTCCDLLAQRRRRASPINCSTSFSTVSRTGELLDFDYGTTRATPSSERPTRSDHAAALWRRNFGHLVVERTWACR